MRGWPFRQRRVDVAPARRTPSSKQLRILSLSGGGIRGLLSAHVLAHLMDRVGAGVGETFHMVAGASTGALMGMALVRPDPVAAAQLPELYHVHGPKIFSRTQSWRLRTNWGLRGPKFPDTGLLGCSRAMAGQTLLSEATVDFVVPAYDVAAGAPYWFQSWAARQDPAWDFLLADVGRASASAPTFFPSAEVRARDGTARHFVDGGLFANNPALRAVQLAKVRYPEVEEIVLVSLGTGLFTRRIPVSQVASWGLIAWLPALIDILHGVNEDQLDHLLAADMAGHRLFSYDIDFAHRRRDMKMPSTALDLATEANLERLDELAERWIEDLDLAPLVALLQGPKAALSPTL